MQIRGLHSHNFSSGTETLTAVWGSVTMTYKSGSWIRGAGRTNDLETFMASYFDKLILVNGTDANLEYNEAYWTATENMAGSPIAKYVASVDGLLFLYNIKILGVRYPSRIWFCDPPTLEGFTWGLDYGTDLVTSGGDATINSEGGHFKAWNVKIGDPFFITSGLNKGKYTVQSITSNTSLELTENLQYSDTGSSFWVGGNWFDVHTDDGDLGMGFGMAGNELICYKKNSVHRYNVSGTTRRQIQDVPGTTSSRSIVSFGGYSYWYHPSGIHRTTGGTSENISTKIEDIIAGVTTANQSKVVGWANQLDKTINMYLGDVTTRDGETITNCVATLDTTSNIWCPRSYDKVIKCAASWLHSSVPEVYIGDDDAGVFQIDTGTTFNGADIPFSLELWPYFPAGEDAIVTFNRIRTYVENGPDVQILYKLYYKPTETEGVYINDDDWHPLQGSQTGTRVDWYFPTDARASGCKLKIVESGGDESFLLEKLTVYYSTPSNF